MIRQEKCTAYLLNNCRKEPVLMPKMNKKIKTSRNEKRVNCDNCPFDRYYKCDIFDLNLQSFGRDEIEQDLVQAINMIFAADKDLIKRGVHERTINFYLAHYFINLFKEKYKRYNIDPEYNRDGYDSKYYFDDVYKKRRIAFPDLIIHKRNCNKYNLLYAELKIDNPSESDYKKIFRFVNDRIDEPWGGNKNLKLFRFKNGVSIVISENSVTFTWYIKDENKWLQNKYKYLNENLIKEQTYTFNTIKELI